MMIEILMTMFVVEYMVMVMVVVMLIENDEHVDDVLWRWI